jgi:hypothetical protein
MEKGTFQKIYTKITQITKATCSLEAEGVGYEELASVNGKLAQVVKIQGKTIITCRFLAEQKASHPMRKYSFMANRPHSRLARISQAVSLMPLVIQSMADQPLKEKNAKLEARR